MSVKKANSDEIDIIRQAKTGNKDAFTILVKRYQKRLYLMVFKYLRSHDLAEDVVQKSFIEAWKYLGTFEGRSSFLTWLFRIAINNSKKTSLENKNEQMVNIDDVEIAEYPTTLEDISGLERNALLTSEIQKLTKKQQMLLHLRIHDDLSFQQIGEILGCTEATAKAHFHHVKNLLKKSLSKITGEGDKNE